MFGHNSDGKLLELDDNLRHHFRMKSHANKTKERKIINVSLNKQVGDEKENKILSNVPKIILGKNLIK